MVDLSPSKRFMSIRIRLAVYNIILIIYLYIKNILLSSVQKKKLNDLEDQANKRRKNK